MKLFGFMALIHNCIKYDTAKKIQREADRE